MVANMVTAAGHSSGLANASLSGRLARDFILVFTVIIVIGKLGVDVMFLINVVTVATAMLLGGGARKFDVVLSGCRFKRSENFRKSP